MMMLSDTMSFKAVRVRVNDELIGEVARTGKGYRS